MKKTKKESKDEETASLQFNINTIDIVTDFPTYMTISEIWEAELMTHTYKTWKHMW